MGVAEERVTVKSDENTKAPAMLERAAEVEALVKTAKDNIAMAKALTKDLNETEVDPDIKKTLEHAVKKLEAVSVSLDSRIAQVEPKLKKFRSEARKKTAQELDELRANAFAVLRHHKAQKKLTADAFFAEVDSKKQGKIDESTFVTFFGKCEKVEGVDTPPTEELKRLFVHLDDESNGFLSKESFGRIIKAYMKVVKDTVMTSVLDIKDKESKTVTRLAIGDVVEVLQPPQKEDNVGVMRVQAKSMSDGSEGWITVQGNQDTTYLQECTGNYKVVKETILTEGFDLSAKKEEIRLFIR